MMPASDPRDVVDRYFTALRDKDFDAMRALLHDDVSFKGPMGATDGNDEYVAAMKRVTATMTGIKRIALFAEGEDVCQVDELTLGEPDATLPVAQWLKIREGRISSVRHFFDARPYG